LPGIGWDADTLTICYDDRYTYFVVFIISKVYQDCVVSLIIKSTAYNKSPW